MQLRRYSLVAILATTTVLGACTSPARFEPDSQTTNANSGALMGGIMGAVIGIAGGDNADERRAGAIKGGVLGAIAGGVIGTQLDKQAAELEASMGSNSVMIENTGESLIVTLPQDILFATDSATLRADLQADLIALARNLNTYPESSVQIIGHTDNVGSAAYNEDLSLRRANAVLNVLAGQGVLVSRITPIGMGENRPVSTNLTEEGRAQNRRVEIVILPF